MVAKLLAVKTSERVRNIQFNLNNLVENFECFWGDNRIESKKESITIDYFIILSDGKSFHVSNTLRFKVLQHVLFGFYSQNRISNNSFGRIQTFVFSYFNWNTEERGLFFQVFSPSFSSSFNK